MLNGSASARVLVLLVAAACLAVLVQRYLASDAGAPEPAAVPARPQPAPPATTPPRRIDPAPSTAPAPQPIQNPEPAPAPMPAPAPEATLPPAPAPELPPAPPPVAAAPAPTPPPQAAIDAAEQSAEPRAVDLVDLNTGTLAQLNGLQGGGAIGRAIIQHRPYTAIDELLSKRVLSRATYQRIKDQVTVR